MSDQGATSNRIRRCLDQKTQLLQKQAFIALLTRLLDANSDGKLSLAEMTKSTSDLTRYHNPMVRATGMYAAC